MDRDKSFFSSLGENKLLILSIILGLIGIGLSSYVISINENDYVHKNNCNRPAGDFAVQENSTSTDVLKLCGKEKNEECVLNVQNLSEAIRECNRRSEFCNKFIYPVSGNYTSMKIVSLTGNKSYSETNHSYIRQNGITFRGDKNYENVNNSVTASLII